MNRSSPYFLVHQKAEKYLETLHNQGKSLEEVKSLLLKEDYGTASPPYLTILKILVFQQSLELVEKGHEVFPYLTRQMCRVKDLMFIDYLLSAANESDSVLCALCHVLRDQQGVTTENDKGLKGHYKLLHTHDLVKFMPEGFVIKA